MFVIELILLILFYSLENDFEKASLVKSSIQFEEQYIFILCFNNTVDKYEQKYSNESRKK